MSKKLCWCCQQGLVSGGEGSYDICDICDWEDDGVQAADPEYQGGANHQSLNEYYNQFCQTEFDRQMQR